MAVHRDVRQAAVPHEPVEIGRNMLRVIRCGRRPGEHALGDEKAHEPFDAREIASRTRTSPARPSAMAVVFSELLHKHLAVAIERSTGQVRPGAKMPCRCDEAVGRVGGVAHAADRPGKDRNKARMRPRIHRPTLGWQERCECHVEVSLGTRRKGAGEDFDPNQVMRSDASSTR